MAVQDIVRPDRGTARKHFAKDATNAAAGGLTDDERTDDEGNEPVAMMISATTQNVTITIDGTTPTATVGHELTTGESFRFIPGLSNIKNLDWIRATGTNGVIQITLLY